jgi:hypothetical protein
MITLNLTEEKAKALLHCLIRTSAKGNELTLGMKIEDELVKLINKPSETTNEKPKDIKFTKEELKLIYKAVHCHVIRFNNDIKSIVDKINRFIV